MKKGIIKAFVLAAAALMLVSAAGCDGGGYYDYLDEAKGYDKSLFYVNTGVVQAADPTVITVGDTFYLYATNADETQTCSDIKVYSSKNLSDWEAHGPAFVPARDAWAINSLWAPEVIEKDGVYYMYYSGYNLSTGRKGIGVATSDSPVGPFHEIEGTFNGRIYSRTVMPFSFGFPAIDPQPFIDDDGSVYLYFSRDQVNGQSSIYACQLMDDMVTVVSGTLTEAPLIKPSQDWEGPNSSPNWNEAPFVFKHDNKYYLTYSANYYQSRAYAVGVAVSDNPLSGFEKVDYNPVLEANAEWAFVSGTGHNCIFPSPDGTELWMAYHSHIDTVNGGDERKINFDRVVFDGDRLMVAGPSTTPQPLPSGCSAYQNLAPEARLSSDAGNEDLYLLTDGIINYYYDGVAEYEYYFNGTRKITLTFDEEVYVKAISVYDSADYELSAKSLDVALDSVSFNGIAFNPAYRYVDDYDFDVKIPGTAAIVQFAEVATKTVTITLKGEIALNEIVVLARYGGTL